ncbi:MAG: hypothetical protein EA397_12505 [Deltaproteobacteria bacterium]|nr:MAG: hypothetical protein EA397_12505 [Deltaproteobacteria bacterium]
MRRVSLLLVLSACSTAIDEPELTSEPSQVDTDSSSDTSSDKSSETSSDRQTESSSDVENEPVTFVLDREPEEQLVLALAPLVDDALQPAWQTFPFEGVSTTVLLPPAPEAHLGPIGEGANAFEGAIYVPYVFVDLNDDGVHDPDEPVRGVGPSAMGWFRDVPLRVSFLGFVDGWNGLRLEGEIPSALPLSQVPLELNLTPNLSLTVEGEVGEGLSVEDFGLAVVPTSVFAEVEVEALLVDQDLESPFTLTLTDAPPPDHDAPDIDLPGLSIQVPMAYLRGEGEGWPGSDPEAQRPICFHGEPVVMVWTPIPTDASLALGLAAQDLAPGWGITTIASFDVDSDGPPLTEEQALELSIDLECEFPPDEE